MLKHLLVRDFAIIEEIEIEFSSGMTVFTGETGAGKSIIVDALGLILGDRADSTVIRTNCDNTEITAIFDIDKNSPIPGILEEQEISLDDELMIRRVINRDGRSRAYVNGSPVPISILKQLGENLVDIHGQHAHQSLLRKNVQRLLLDAYGDYKDVIEKVHRTSDEWHTATRELKKIMGDNRDRDAQIALIQYQVQELEALHPEPGEITGLEEEYKRLSNASRLLEIAQSSINLLDGEEHSVSEQLHHVKQEINSVVRFDQKLSGIIELLENAVIHTSEVVSELNHYLGELDLDPERLQQLDTRITSLHDTARKHKVKPEELADKLATLQEQLEQLQDNEQRLATLEKQRDVALQEYHTAAKQLHEKRIRCARELGPAIESKMKELGMPGGRFSIDVQPVESGEPSTDGMDRIEFLVSINPGQPLLPLTRVASGGELSRISLAIQVIGSSDKSLPTLVFDEVDSGIGGGIAEIVGKLLHRLAENYQVFCVTHLPQVAATGDHHLQVNKSTLAETTLTQVIYLEQQDRVEEIARMLGGMKITEQTRAHAREMLQGN